MTKADEDCTWTGDPDQRTLRHLTECPACERRWPILAADVRERIQAKEATPERTSINYRKMGRGG